MKKVVGTLLAAAAAIAMVIGCAAPGAGPAGYLGAKTPTEEKADWDIVFSDGSATPFTENLTLTNAQIENAAGIVFTCGTDKLIAGLPQQGLEWCKAASNLGAKAAASLYGTGYKNGIEGKDRLKVALQTQMVEDDTDTDGKYPAWQYCWNYSKGIYSSGWYLPSATELGKLITSANKEKVFAIYKLLENEMSETNLTFWSSSTGSEGNEATGYSFSSPNTYSRTKTCTVIPVYNLTTTSYAKYTVTIHNYNETTASKDYIVLAGDKLKLTSITNALKFNANGDKYICLISTNADGSGTTYMSSAEIEVTENMDLYFHWYYGQNLPTGTNKAVGDIVFDDGSFTHCTAASFTDAQKNHAVGVIFYTDENNGDGTYYKSVTYGGKQIVLSKNVLAAIGGDVSTDYKGTRIISKTVKPANNSTHFYFSGNSSSVTCLGDGKSKNSGLNAYFAGSGHNDYFDPWAAFHYNLTAAYSLIDGYNAKGIVTAANNKLGIFDGMPSDCYVPSIVELEAIYYYKDLLASQMQKIGGGFITTATGSFDVSYWSCNTVPAEDRSSRGGEIYYLELRSGKTGAVPADAVEAVKTGSMNGPHRILYCKKLN